MLRHQESVQEFVHRSISREEQRQHFINEQREKRQNYLKKSTLASF